MAFACSENLVYNLHRFHDGNIRAHLLQYSLARGEFDITQTVYIMRYCVRKREFAGNWSTLTLDSEV